MPNFAIRLTSVYSRGVRLSTLAGVYRQPYSSYNIPISGIDPMTGNILTYHEYAPSLRGQQFSITTPVNDPNFVNTYKALELSAVKRMSNDWQMLGAVGSIWPNKTFASDLAPLTPNAEILSRDTARRWYFKLGGSYRISKIDALISSNLNGVSGEPFQRTVLITGGIPFRRLPFRLILRGGTLFKCIPVTSARKVVSLATEPEMSARVDRSTR